MSLVTPIPLAHGTAVQCPQWQYLAIPFPYFSFVNVILPLEQIIYSRRLTRNTELIFAALCNHVIS